MPEPDSFIASILPYLPYALGGLAIAIFFLILGWAAAKKGVLIPGWLSRLANRMGGLGNPEAVTEEQLLDLVDDAGEQELIDDEQAEMITSVLELRDVTAADVMTHRMDMNALDENAPCSRAVALALETGHSRIPVYRKNVDHVIGFVFVKDLLRMFDDPAEAARPVKELVRPPFFVPESCPAQRLLMDFRRQRAMIAIVVDEWGGTAGLVTMEDVLEEIVGNIQDEYDQEEEELVEVEDGYMAEGSLDLEDVFEAFEMEMPDTEEDESFDTVGGLITERLGRFPEPEETVVVPWGGLIFTVVEAEERRVVRVKVTRDLNPDVEAEVEG